MTGVDRRWLIYYLERALDWIDEGVPHRAVLWAAEASAYVSDMRTGPVMTPEKRQDLIFDLELVDARISRGEPGRAREIIERALNVLRDMPPSEPEGE